MIRLCIDTAHRYLVIAIIKDEKLLDSYSEYAWKKQSESVFVEMIKLLDKHQITPDDIDEVVITRGPGSYTGIRIAMSIAKVFTALKNKTLYTVSTLQLYAGKKDISVILDARSNRVYYGKYKNGKMCEECIKTIDELDLNENYIGDTNLINIEPSIIDFGQNFYELKDNYELVENIHALTPTYLKEESDYLK